MRLQASSRRVQACRVSQRERPPRPEKQCPLPTTHTRMHQFHAQWHRSADDYRDPDEFLASLNAALVSLRPIPEMLAEERRHVPDFAAWYLPHDAAFRADPLLRSLVKARKQFVHHGDVKLHSRARVRVLVEGRDLPEIELRRELAAQRAMLTRVDDSLPLLSASRPMPIPRLVSMGSGRTERRRRRRFLFAWTKQRLLRPQPSPPRTTRRLARCCGDPECRIG